MPISSSGNLSCWRFDIFSGYNNLTCVFSTSAGGTDSSENGKLNLGFSGSDSEESVRANRKLFLRAAGGAEEKIAIGNQVHSTNVKIVNAAGSYDRTDGLLTSSTDLSLIVSSADCLPVFFFDMANSVIGVVHSGWKGTRDGIAAKAVNLMKEEYKTEQSNLICGIGPSIEAACYEVGEEVASQFDEEFLTQSPKRGYYLDLKKAVVSQLVGAGVPQENIEVSPICNRCDADNFFSYRREGRLAGRMWGLIRLEE